MASIPSTGSLIATHDYYRRRIGSTSSNSSCGSSEYAGEVIPHPPGTDQFLALWQVLLKNIISHSVPKVSFCFLFLRSAETGLWSLVVFFLLPKQTEPAWRHDWIWTEVSSLTQESHKWIKTMHSLNVVLNLSFVRCLTLSNRLIVFLYLFS